MKLIGYCTECHKIKYVEVSGQALARMSATGSNVAQGICADCEEKGRTR